MVIIIVNYLNLFGAKKCVEKSCLLQCKYQRIFKNKNLQKTLLFIYSDLEPLLEKINKSENNPGKSFTTKVNNRVVCGYLIF